MKPEFSIIYEQDEQGWWVATIPEVPGAFSQGKNREEARVNALDALAELMAARRELALRQTKPGAVVEALPIPV